MPFVPNNKPIASLPPFFLLPLLSTFSLLPLHLYPSSPPLPSSSSPPFLPSSSLSLLFSITFLLVLPPLHHSCSPPHPSSYSQSSQHRTTLIILCEDGSLRIYVANNNANTEYWLQPQFQPTSPLVMLRSRVRKKDPAVRRVEHPKFPIDFFEHCQQLQYSEIEVGRGEEKEGRGGEELGGQRYTVS